MIEDEMVGWHHRLNGYESEQTPGYSEGQRNMVCCSPWGCKESNTTERLNNNSNNKKNSFENILPTDRRISLLHI